MRRAIITWDERHEIERNENTVVIIYDTPFSIPKMTMAAMRMAPDEIVIRMESRGGKHGTV